MGIRQGYIIEYVYTAGDFPPAPGIAAKTCKHILLSARNQATASPRTPSLITSTGSSYVQRWGTSGKNIQGSHLDKNRLIRLTNMTSVCTGKLKSSIFSILYLIFLYLNLAGVFMYVYIQLLLRRYADC